MTDPRVAVVIATRDRETRLAFALEALARQSLGPDGFEVVVVRAPSPRRSPVDGPDGLAVTFLEAPVARASAQRNAGWRAARAPLVAFTDDDCRPDSGWLEALVRSADAASVIQGRTEPDPDEAHLLTGLARSVEIAGPDPWHACCNVCYPRALLEELDGFDESFEAPWGEDTDLGLRARSAGARFDYAPEALVWHAVHARSLPAAVREARRAEWIPLVVARHPGQRQALFGRVFLNRDHATLALAICGALACPRRRAASILAVAPWLGIQLASGLRGGPLVPRRLARTLLFCTERLVVDLVELGAALHGSRRHRALVV